jgi:hypothetical protein
MIGHRSSSMKEGWDCDYDYQSIILRGYMYKYTCFSFHTKINKQKPWKGINWIQCGKNIALFCKKSLKIPKGLSESVYRKRKRTKGQATIYKTYT